MHVNRGLIDLPLSLPSIPIVNPLVTALVGDSNTKTTQRSGSGTTSTPVSEPTTLPASGGNGSGSGNGGGSQGGGYTTSPGSGSGSGSGGGDGSNSNGGGDNGGSNNGGSSNSGGDSSSNNGSSGGGSGGDPTSSNNGSDSSSSTSGGHSLVANAGAQAPPVTGTETSPTHTAGATTKLTTVFSNGTPIATQTVSSGPSNVGNYPSSTGSGGDGSSSNTDGSNGSSNGTSSANGDTSKHGLPTGAIVGIVISILILFLALFILFLRKRSKARRTERRNRWWQTKNAETEEARRWSAGGTGDATVGSSSGSGIVSARSSFATTFDHAANESSMTLDFTNVSPPMPPMAEIRDAHGPGLLLHAQDNTPLIDVEVASPTERRVSTYSNRSSTSSDIHAQYLAYTDPFITHQIIPPSPMSVRPFSPSDLFSFPKPPTGDHPKIHIATPDSPNPFADPNPFSNFSSPSPTTLTVAVEPGIEVVRRAFTPTLHDEISVQPGDRVRISKVFDDGWALIEKYPLSPNDTTSKGKAKQIQGLVPIDCLRESGEDLPSFLASKRLSSYGATGRQDV